MSTNRPYRISIRLSDTEMDKITELKEELGYRQHTALFLVSLAIDMYEAKVEDHAAKKPATDQH